MSMRNLGLGAQISMLENELRRTQAKLDVGCLKPTDANFGDHIDPLILRHKAYLNEAAATKVEILRVLKDLSPSDGVEIKKILEHDLKTLEVLTGRLRERAPLLVLRLKR